MTRRGSLNTVGMVLLIMGTVLPASTFSTALRLLAIGLIMVAVALTARDGYRRRLPHWTRESWRRYVLVCLIPLGALLLLVVMLTAHELRLSVVGDAGSTQRGVFAGVATVLLFVFAIGLFMALNYLSDGDPTRQFTWPRRSPTNR